MILKKNFEKIKSIIALYVKEKEMCSAYISKINLNCETQILLLMIPNGEKTDGIILQ